MGHGLLAVASIHANPVLLAVAGLVGGFCVGLTGMGGGALMTPGLVLIFHIDPKVAVANDLVNSLVMKPIGGSVHMRRGTIHWPLVGCLILGSVPSAFFSAFLLNQFGDSQDVAKRIKQLLGWALLVACTAIIAKAVLTARSRGRIDPDALDGTPGALPYTLKRGPTVLIGVVGGFIVGMTSVGSGSLMIVLLMLLYPRLTSKSLVGTDLVQAVPLVMSAAIANILVNGLEWSIVIPLIIGSVPGCIIGAKIAPRVPQSYIRRGIVIVLTMSGLALLDKAGWAPLGSGEDDTHPVFIALVGVALLVVVPLVWGLLRRSHGLPMFGTPTVQEIEGESTAPERPVTPQK